MRTTQNIIPFKTYFGGKSGSGTYQTIINHIPPHRVFMSLFAGNCGVFKNMKRAEWTILNDIDYMVFQSWHETGLWVPGDLRIENKDAISFMHVDLQTSEYKRLLNHTFIYLDPPYLMSTRKRKIDTYKHEFATESDHLQLINTVKNLPIGIKVMVSHYPCDLYNDGLKDWNTVDFKSTTRRGQVNERIYMNYDLDGHLHDYSYIGQNFRVREKYKRIMTNFFLKLDRLEPLLRNAMLSEYEQYYKNKKS